MQPAPGGMHVYMPGQGGHNIQRGDPRSVAVGTTVLRSNKMSGVHPADLRPFENTDDLGLLASSNTPPDIENHYVSETSRSVISVAPTNVHDATSR